MPILNSTIVRKKNIAIVLCIIAFVCCCEIGFRMIKTQVSGNIRQLKEIPLMAAHFADSNSLRVLFLGNSLIGEAIDQQNIKKLLKDLLKKDIVVEKVVPDGSDLSMWNFLFKNEFIGPGLRPDIIVIGFAWDNALCDQEKIDELYLSEIPISLEDLPILYDFGLKKPEEILGFLTGKLSSAYANHETIRNRIFDGIIPYYRQETQTINSLQKQKTETPTNPSQKNEITYNRLSTFCKMTRTAGIQPVFVAMPLLNRDYFINPKLQEVLDKQAVLIDCRKNIPGFDPATMFKDRMHLNQQGRNTFTGYFSNILGPIISKHVTEENLIHDIQ